jgi:hypothetical protein
MARSRKLDAKCEREREQSRLRWQAFKRARERWWLEKLGPERFWENRLKWLARKGYGNAFGQTVAMLIGQGYCINATL